MFFLILLSHFVASVFSNFGGCIFDESTDTVYKTFQVQQNSTFKQSFHIEQYSTSEDYKYKNFCVKGDIPRLWKCLIRKPMDNWDLVIKEKKKQINKSHWYFNQEKCVCLNIKPTYKLKVEINDAGQTSSLFKVNCHQEYPGNMLTSDHDEIYLDFGNENRTLPNSCTAEQLSFSINPFNKSTSCNPAKICSNTKFTQCLNKGTPYCVTFSNLFQNHFILKYFDCNINSGSLKVNWDFKNLGIQNVSLNFQQGSISVFSKNISSPIGEFVRGGLNNDNTTMYIDSCFHCKCFRTKKICFDQTGPTLKKGNTEDGLRTDIVLLIVFGVLLLCLVLVSLFVFYKKKGNIDDNQNPIIVPRLTEMENIPPENIYEEIPVRSKICCLI